MWENNDTVSILVFFTALINVPRHKLFQSKLQDLEELPQPLENEDDQQTEEDWPQMKQFNQEEQPLQEQQESWVRDDKSTKL